MSISTQERASLLCRLLSATRLYDLSADGPLLWEIQAYLAGFALVEERRKEALDACFPQTCGEERLRQWERLLGMAYLPGAALEERRELVLRRLAVGPGDNTAEGILRALRAAGVEASITEDTQNRTLTVQITDIGAYGSLSEAQAQAEKMMPSHLEIWYLLDGPTWLQVQFANYTWEAIEALDHTWRENETAELP